MKKIFIALLLSGFVAEPVFAADTQRSVGANYSTAGALGVQGEFDISSMADDGPVLAQIFLKNYSQDLAPGVSWDTTGIGAAAIYDFNVVGGLDKKMHPYVGIGLVYISYKWKGAGSARPYFGAGSGLYFVGGLRYVLAPQVAADFNYNVFGDLTAGINYSF